MFRSANGEGSRGLEARLLNQSGREESAAATDRPIGGFRDINPIARRDENPQRSVDLLGFECRVERIGEQRDFWARLGTMGFAIGTEAIRSPRGQAPPGGEP